MGKELWKVFDQEGKELFRNSEKPIVKIRAIYTGHYFPEVECPFCNREIFFDIRLDIPNGRPCDHYKGLDHKKCAIFEKEQTEEKPKSKKKK